MARQTDRQPLGRHRRGARFEGHDQAIVATNDVGRTDHGGLSGRLWRCPGGSREVLRRGSRSPREQTGERHDGLLGPEAQVSQIRVSRASQASAPSPGNWAANRSATKESTVHAVPNVARISA